MFLLILLMEITVFYGSLILPVYLPEITSEFLSLSHTQGCSTGLGVLDVKAAGRSSRLGFPRHLVLVSS